MQAILDYLPGMRSNRPDVQCANLPSDHPQREFICRPADEVSEAWNPWTAMKSMINWGYGVSVGRLLTSDRAESRYDTSKRDIHERGKASTPEDEYIFHVKENQPRVRPLNEEEVLDTPERMVRNTRQAVEHGYDSMKEGYGAVKNEAQHLKDSVKHQAGNVKGSVKHGYENVKHTAEDMKHGVEHGYENIKENVKHRVEDVEAGISGAAKTVKDKFNRVVGRTKEGVKEGVEDVRGYADQAAWTTREQYERAKDTAKRGVEYGREAAGEGIRRSKESGHDLYDRARQDYHAARGAVPSLSEQLGIRRGITSGIFTTDAGDLTLPVTAFYLAIWALFWLNLYRRVWNERNRTNVWEGDGLWEVLSRTKTGEMWSAGKVVGEKEPSVRGAHITTSPVSLAEFTSLRHAIMGLQSQSHMLPFAALVFALLEMSNASRLLLHAAMLTFTVSRVLVSESPLGSTRSKTGSYTSAAILSFSALALLTRGLGCSGIVV